MFNYVLKKDYLNVKKDIIKIINLVQDNVRKYFTYKFEFIGVEPKNLVTVDIENNFGYDMNINIEINDDEELYDANKIMEILDNAFTNVCSNFKNISSYLNKNEFALLIKEKNMIHTVYINVVNMYYDEELDFDLEEIIIFDEENNEYIWDDVSDYYDYIMQLNYIKDNNLGNILRTTYLKMINKERNKKSLDILIESVNFVYKKYCKEA